jgi:hypothetical protein
MICDVILNLVAQIYARIVEVIGNKIQNLVAEKIFVVHNVVHNAVCQHYCICFQQVWVCACSASGAYQGFVGCSDHFVSNDTVIVGG